MNFQSFGPGEVARRAFLKSVGTAAVGMVLPGWRGIAGPFDHEAWSHYIPAEKKLSPEWLKSLFERGVHATWLKSRNELRHIGMPVGGICCGTLYLGGDGRLWNWDIFNQKTEGILPRKVSWAQVGMDFQTGDSFIRPRDGATYVKPAVREDSQSIEQGFAIQVESSNGIETRRLSELSWEEIGFTGSYPIGRVEYSDPHSAVGVRLEAFSPFIPLNADDSGLPAVIFHFQVTNRTSERIKVRLSGWLQNATSFYSARRTAGIRVNRIRRVQGATLVAMRFEPNGDHAKNGRPDILVEDFENGYGAWKIEGDAFGTEPASRSVIPPYQGDVGGQGAKVVNSHASAPGSSVGEKDDRIGRLISQPFKLQRRFLCFYIGGGRRDDAGIKLVVQGKPVRSATGHNNNQMRQEVFDVGEFEGEMAHIEIIDNAKGAWGNIGVDHILQTDSPKTEEPANRMPDFGTMTLGVVGQAPGVTASAAVDRGELPYALFKNAGSGPTEVCGEAPIGGVGKAFALPAGKSAEVRFVLTWHFPKTTLPVPDAKSGNYYARRFQDAAAVASHVARELPRLEKLTRIWTETWHDSTLPHWFLQRTFANTSILATTTAHRFGTGRFWGWEGVGCCEGTCTHVWHYAQAVGRLFPEIERDLRERVDFGAGFEAATGMIRHRAEGTGPAIDGHCGRILGVWREHQMSVDSSFLARVWPKVKAAVEYVIRHDSDGDGILDGAQENTLDAAWYGQIAWITTLALAALRAAEEMALEMGDGAFAARCRDRFERGRRAVETRLFNGEYFFQIADPRRARSLGTYDACHIDQVHGQSWAWQVNLGRVLDQGKTLSALRSLWKYNFAPDVGPFRKKFTAGRPYALAGEGGLVMTSNPRLIPDVYGISSWQIGYFNECMSGFEHQAASHMVAEGMVMEGLAVTRAVHDRYHPSRRNPYNEIECSDHYARAMASYGTFISACGYEHHGPKRHIGFAPKTGADDFRAAFTAAEGWGSYSQRRSGTGQVHRIEIKHGRLRLKSLSVELASGRKTGVVTARLGPRKVGTGISQTGVKVLVTFENELHIDPQSILEVSIA